MAHTSQKLESQVTSRAATPALVLTLIVLLLLLAIPVAQAQTFQVLHRFRSSLGGGGNPYAGLTIAANGTFYGTTSTGGTHDYGTVFKFAQAGTGWLLTPIYSFSSGSDGFSPTSRVVFGPDGSLYGNTPVGGNSSPNCDSGCGTVFQLQPPLSGCKTPLCSWRKTTIYSFSGTDGGYPEGDVVFDAAGNIYGVTQVGGQYDAGVAYKLSRSGDGWTDQALHQFVWPVKSPSSGVTLDRAGNLYGTVTVDSYGHGGVYELTASGELTTLYEFQEGTDGGYPRTGLIFDSAGNLYGSTPLFGANGGGTIFELSPSGDGWTFSLLYSLSGNGGGPAAPLVMDHAGNLYGTNLADGAYGYGSVFKLTPGIAGWTYTSLHDFDYDDGAAPMSTVVFDSQGNLYGTTAAGGSSYGCGQGCGVIWEITP